MLCDPQEKINWTLLLSISINLWHSVLKFKHDHLFCPWSLSVAPQCSEMHKIQNNSSSIFTWYTVSGKELSFRAVSSCRCLLRSSDCFLFIFSCAYSNKTIRILSTHHTLTAHGRKTENLLEVKLWNFLCSLAIIISSGQNCF